MILFYVVSDMGIIHAINAKQTWYPDEEAILISRYVSGSSEILIDNLCASGIFKQVLLMPFPVVSTREGILKKSKILQAFHRHHQYEIYIKSCQIHDKSAFDSHLFCSPLLDGINSL